MMSCRPFLLDLQVRNRTICRSCIANFQRKGAKSWIASYSDDAASKGPAPLPRRARATTQRRFRQNNGAISNKPLTKEHNIGEVDQIPDPNVTVRYFEENGGRRRELQSETAFSESMSNLGAAELKQALFTMRDSLQSPQDKMTFEAMIKQMGGLWKGVQSQADIDAVSASMEAYSREIDEEIEDATQGLPQAMADQLKASIQNMGLEEDNDTEQPLRLQGQGQAPQISSKSWTVNQRRKISKLNTALSHAYREIQRNKVPSVASISMVYKAYHSARLAMSRKWDQVPIDAWDFLWTIFSTDDAANIHRLTHISLLSRDMSEANVTLSPQQQLLTIEAVFVEGWETKALENWRRCIGSLGSEASETFKDFWELGVRMHCRQGDLQQAERAANTLLDKKMDARILKPIIQTWCEQNTPQGQEQGWAKYRQMVQLLGNDIRLEDYDQVIAYFLTNSQTENALYAFVDMMSNGQIDLTKQKFMPSVVANKFFLGKWLKRLIGAGDLDGADSVVKFMLSKGVQASPIQLNGLIGAWQRSGSAVNMEKAEQMAWQMINSRIDFVHARKKDGSAAAASSSSRSQSTQKTMVYPRATLETFCIIAENYRQRDLQSRQEELWEIFRQAEISPDAFLINQLLESHLQAGKPKVALQLYKSLVTERGIKPDPYTFSALWKTLPVNRLYVIPPNELEEQVTEMRNLFAETLKYRQTFAPGGMDGQLSRKILHSFRRSQDYTGLLIALATLKEVFKFVPADMLVLEMVIGTHKLAWETTSQRRQLMVAKRDMEHALLRWADGDAEKLEGKLRGEALHAHLQKIYLDKVGDDKTARRLMLDAAKEMGALEVLSPKKGGLV